MTPERTEMEETPEEGTEEMAPVTVASEMVEAVDEISLVEIEVVSTVATTLASTAELDQSQLVLEPSKLY